MGEGGSEGEREEQEEWWDGRGRVWRPEGSRPLRGSLWCGGSRAHSCCWDEDVGCDCCEASW